MTSTLRNLLLVPLLALPVASDDMVVWRIDKDMTVAQLLAIAARHSDWTVLCDPSLPLHEQRLGTGIRGNVLKIPRHGLADAYRGILAFYEVHLVDVGGGVRLAVRWHQGFFKSRLDPVRCELAAIGLGTTLEFDGTIPRNIMTSVALPPCTRNRLLLALRFGLHPRGRATAARLLGALGPHFKQTADALARALDDEDATVRLAAVKALGDTGKAAHHVRPRLRALLENKALRTAAERALQLTRTLDD